MSTSGGVGGLVGPPFQKAVVMPDQGFGGCFENDAFQPFITKLSDKHFQKRVSMPEMLANDYLHKDNAR